METRLNLLGATGVLVLLVMEETSKTLFVIYRNISHFNQQFKKKIITKCSLS